MPSMSKDKPNRGVRMWPPEWLPSAWRHRLGAWLIVFGGVVHGAPMLRRVTQVLSDGPEGAQLDAQFSELVRRELREALQNIRCGRPHA